MELRDLQYFLVCVEAGKLVRAAERLRVAQPTLSHAIHRLEQELGEALLERPANRRAEMRPTPAGMILAARARRMVAEVDGVAGDLADLRGLLRGDLRLGSIQSLNASLLPRPLTRFVDQHPGVRVTLQTLATAAVAPTLRAGDLDLGITAGVPEAELAGLEIQHLAREVFVAVVRADDPLARAGVIALADLAGGPLVLPPGDARTGAIIRQAFAQAGIPIRVVLELQSADALRETVRAGLGRSILPAGSVSPDDRGLVAVSLADPAPSRDVFALLPGERHASRAARAFLVLLADGDPPSRGASPR